MRKVEPAGRPPAQSFEEFMVVFAQQAPVGTNPGGTGSKDRTEPTHSRAAGGRAGRDGRGRKEEHGPEETHHVEPDEDDGDDGGGDSGSDGTTTDTDEEM